ncbi:MAG: YCF48-related protein [Desulfuromonadales bacterium]|nr:YCF48-related protein [Desulfuromonadales bacterium]
MSLPRSIVCLLLILPAVLTGLGLLSAPACAAPSELMPLAAQSLLLDGQFAGDRVVTVGERGHILISADQGRSWQQQPVPTRATLTSLFFVDSDLGFAAGHDGVILRSEDGGQSWQLVYADPDDERPILDLWFHDRRRGFAVGAYGLLLTTGDSGRSWHAVEFSPASLTHEVDWGWDEGEDEPLPIDFHLNQIAATPGGRLFIAAEAGNLYRSDDGARSWLALPSPYVGSLYGVLPINEQSLLLYGLRGHLFRSDDAGMTWQELSTGVRSTLYDAARLRDGRIVLVGQEGTVLFGADSRDRLTLLAQPGRRGIARVLELPDGALLLIGEQGARRLALPDAAGGAKR